MQNNLILRVSAGLGNQLFMYASAFAIAKKLNRNLLIDNETAFESRKNIRTYDLNNFNITSSIAPDKLKFKNYTGYLFRKTLKKFDYLKKNKSFLIEKRNINKISHFNENFLHYDLAPNVFIEGHFETEKYFNKCKNDIINEFSFANSITKIKNNLVQQISNSNSVCICIRQGRYNEGLQEQNNPSMINKSWAFTLEQIKYTLKSVEKLKRKLDNPKFFLWTNDFSNLNKYFPPNEFISVNNIDNSNYIFDLYLMTLAKHYIVAPTSFNWWGAWLSKNRENSLILRPSEKLFSDFFLNNKDFWPNSWEIVN
jgi:hypothetical protein